MMYNYQIHFADAMFPCCAIQASMDSCVKDLIWNRIISLRGDRGVNLEAD